MFDTRVLSRLARPVCGFALIALLALAGCGDDDDNPVNPGGGSTSTSFTGMAMSGTNSGKLTVSVGSTSLAAQWGNRTPAVVINATGVLVINGSTVNLTGTYDNAADSLTLSGGGYTFVGTYETVGVPRPSLVGTWTGPGGATGEFVCPVGSAATVKVYLGQFYSTTSPPNSGVFSMVVIDTLLAGFAHPDGAEGGVFFEGTVAASGGVRPVTIDYDGDGYTLLAPGFIEADSLHGTYTFTDVAGGGADDDAGTYLGGLR
jgi:hypothetical protein